MDYVVDITALHASFAVAAQDPDLMVRFYARLFQRHPVLRPMFDGRLSAMHSGWVLRAIYRLLCQVDEAPASVRNDLRALGVRHLGYGVTEEMYAWVGEAFVDTLAETLGPSWTPRVELAWQEAYGLASAIMVEGAEIACVPTLRAAS